MSEQPKDIQQATDYDPNPVYMDDATVPEEDVDGLNIVLDDGGEEDISERNWFFIHCYSGYEKKVEHALRQRIDSMGMQDQIYDVLIPTEDEIEVKDGKRRTVEKRVFPGYVMVQMHWYKYSFEIEGLRKKTQIVWNKQSEGIANPVPEEIDSLVYDRRLGKVIIKLSDEAADSYKEKPLSHVVFNGVEYRLTEVQSDDLPVFETSDKVPNPFGDDNKNTFKFKFMGNYLEYKGRLNEDAWYAVRNTPGVVGFVGGENQPTPLREEEVKRIVARMDSEDMVVKVDFKIGERVRIVGGPFNDFPGTVASIDSGREKVRVMVDFFGRETAVVLSFMEVERM
ncbi:MAG: hypothetical protein OXE52_08550 [Chloroflexi bacterium]|nr:hypothetical protein [Chloroflexota bacterium]